MRRTRAILFAIAAAAFLLPLLMLRRVPTPLADGQLYASIGRAVELFGIGVPTVTWNSPQAVDHVPFYGPVFFTATAFAFDLFGPHLHAFRLVGALGVVVFLIGAAVLTRRLSRAPERWILTVTVLLLTPEVNAQISSGAMHPVAIGLWIMALAVFAGPQPTGAFSAVGRGAAIGTLLTLAALTTPRTYPFLAGFFAAGIRMLWRRTPRDTRDARLMFLAAVATVGSLFLWWTVAAHGGPVAWARYFWYIFMHEDTDVAILPTAVREFKFRFAALPTPLAAVTGMLAVALALLRHADAAADFGERGGVFVVTATWIGGVITAVLENYTFTLGGYLELPLLAVLLSTPRGLWIVSRRVATTVLAVVLMCDVGVLTIRYARVAASWQARDPAALEEFVRAHVPPGSAVVGPDEPYFFPVESAGSRYRVVSPRSWADWARWVPIIDPAAALVARQRLLPPPRGRFFMWPSANAVPAAYECARPFEVARFHPAASHLDRLGWLGRGRDLDAGYPDTTLYTLPQGCPAGYDPTRRIVSSP